MWTIFALENFYFALNIFSALVFFSIAWLYSDAYKELKEKKEIFKVIAFILIGASFIFRSLDLQGLVINEVKNYQLIFNYLDTYLRSFGYSVLIFALFIDPLQSKPKLNAFILFNTSVLSSLLFLNPILSSFIALLYLRRASVGLERHLYPPSIAFFFLACYELSFSLSNFSNTTNLGLFNLLAAFGYVWYLKVILLIIGIFILGKWVFKYLLKQFESQLFMLLMGLILTIYLIVTVGFTGLLINNLKDQILVGISSQAKVMDFAFNAKREELLSTAKLSANLLRSDLLQTELLRSDLDNDSVVVFDKDGVVTFRQEDIERKGDSVSGDSLVKKILEGREASSIVVKDGVISPTVMIVSGAPITTDGQVTGGVLVGEIIDNSYLEGFVRRTGLSLLVYGGNTLSAGGTLGIKEEDKEVREKVLTKGETLSKETKFLNRSYLSSFSPLLDTDNNPVGMFVVGKPQVEVLNLAGSTLELIFLGTIILLLLSMFPAKLIAQSISKQVK
jgi:hypothetical protein